MRTRLALAFLVAGCTIKNENHCYYNGGSAACAEQDPERGFCSQCTNDNDGCVKEQPSAACWVDGGTESVGTTVSTSTETSTTIASSESTLSATTTSTSSESSTTQAPETSSSTGEPPPCGNGVLDEPEQCDGDAFGDASCQTLGYDGGALSCRPDCFYDLSTCEAPGTCDNDMLDMDEQCDGNEFDVETCAEYDGVYGGGVLECNANCTYNTDDCCVAGGQLCNAATNCCKGDGHCLLGLLVCPL
ncbi:MAG TPA: hypothetical protein VG755_34050 [Nannocystaceae bacterium]|nr:hypothetical protein [Nannocystaceae bacterium]